MIPIALLEKFDFAPILRLRWYINMQIMTALTSLVGMITGGAVSKKVAKDSKI